MSFDFPWTCPDIDAAIGKAHDALADSLGDLLSDACPLLSPKTHEELVKNYVIEFYRNLEDCFEEVRKANESIRKAAEKQVGSLENEVSELRATVQYLESRVES